MLLTPDQVIAAEACGCSLIAATDEQVQRLTMQRRVFRIDARAFLVRRGDAPFETHGTLLALIASQETATTRPAAALASSAQSTPTPCDAQSPSPFPHAEAERPVHASQATSGEDRQPRKAEASAEQTLDPEPAPMSKIAPASVDDEMLAEIAATQGAGRGARVISGHRGGQRPPPRWKTAGKARRGRLK